MLQYQQSIVERLKEIEKRLIQLENETLTYRIRTRENDCLMCHTTTTENDDETIDSCLSFKHEPSVHNEKFSEPRQILYDDNSEECEEDMQKIEFLSENEVNRIYSIAKSRGYFSALLVQNLYSKQFDLHLCPIKEI